MASTLRHLRLLPILRTPLQVGFAHGFAADVGLAQEFAVLIEDAYFVVVFAGESLVRLGMTSAAQRKLSRRSAEISASRLSTSKRVSIR
jgi:hypothetical protein